MRALILYMGLCAAGCGGADISGLYQASTHTMDSSGCGGGAPVGDQPIFRIQRIFFIDQTAYTFEPCASTDRATCFDLGLLSVRFTEPTANGWTDHTFGTTPGTTCTLTESISTATFDHGGLRVQFTHYSTPAPHGSACTDSDAHAAVASMVCISDEVMLATRLGPARL